MEAEKKPSEHVIALANFDGSVTKVEANELRVCVPTRECIQFWAHTLACVVAVIAGIVLMALFRATGPVPDAAVFQAGASLLALGIGVLIPNPAYGALVGKASSRSSS
jgi:hypothetical protein